MISETFHHYGGMQAPYASYPIETFVDSPDAITFVAMNQGEYDYLMGMQYIIGAKLTVVLFQNFHDKAYENYKLVPLDRVMQGVACSYPRLHDLMMSPYGDLQWARVEKAQYTRPYKFGDFI